MLIFRQLFDQESSTYTYLLGDSESREAVIIDPVYEQVSRDHALLDELGLRLLTVTDTHCHADHVTGAWLLKRACGARIGISKNSGVEGADDYYAEGDRIQFGARYLDVRETPGHTNGCLCYVLDDESMAFTGDTLLIRGCGRTDFQQGDARTMYRSVQSKILALPDQTRLYPAHDYKGITSTSVAEEKAYNPRLGGQTNERDFVGYMENLGLPHPKKIDIAVPANLCCGKPKDESVTDNEPTWGPLRLSFAGVWEIDPQALEELLDQVQIIDVRESDEYDGPLGHIKGAMSVPLSELPNETGNLETGKPIVAVCRSGARSAQATVLLKRAGLTSVANLRGGMLRWRDRGLPVVGGVN